MGAVLLVFVLFIWGVGCLIMLSELNHPTPGTRSADLQDSALERARVLMRRMAWQRVPLPIWRSGGSEREVHESLMLDVERWERALPTGVALVRAGQIRLQRARSGGYEGTLDLELAIAATW